MKTFEAVGKYSDMPNVIQSMIICKQNSATLASNLLHALYCIGPENHFCHQTHIIFVSGPPYLQSHGKGWIVSCSEFKTGSISQTVENVYPGDNCLKEMCLHDASHAQ